MSDTGILRVWDPDKAAYVTRVYEGAGSSGVRCLGPFTFSYNTPGLNAGIEFYTPTVNDVLVDAFVTARVGFNGTTPKFDFGPVSAPPTTDGFFWQANAPVVMSQGWPTPATFRVLWYVVGSSLFSARINYYAATKQIQPQQGIIRSADPWKLWVSQNGSMGGAAVGGSAGQGEMYLLIASPSVP